MPITPSPSLDSRELVRRAFNNIELRPKLKHPDKDGVPADIPLQAQHDPKFAKQIMGFREWCEKVYQPSRPANTRQETDR